MVITLITMAGHALTAAQYVQLAHGLTFALDAVMKANTSHLVGLVLIQAQDITQTQMV